MNSIATESYTNTLAVIHKSRMKVHLICYLFFLGIVLNSCTFCGDFYGKYVNIDGNSKKVIEIKKDRSYIYTFTSGDTILKHEGEYEVDSSSCILDFKEWKNFNNRGENLDLFSNHILFISDDYLNDSPDGTSRTSFKKKEN